MTQTTYQSHIIGTEGRVVARVLAALPAAGAYDADPIEVAVNGKSHAVLYIQYERGAAGGAFQIQPWYSPFSTDAEATVLGVEAWYQETNNQVNAVAAGADTINTFQRAEISYTSTAAGVETTIVELTFRQAIERLILPAAETGVAQDPGELGIIIELF